MKRQGYLWNYFGFTRLHLWGVHIVSAGLAAAGTFFMCISVLKMWEGAPTPETLVLLACSGAAFLGCIATVAASILALLFFWGAHHMGLLEAKPDDGR
ncbi:hypothetical protein OVA24_16840 [Luteolibacter sp. SL250]|uniref:hypothetical protein n=1 Tax=Luteolibacter sp. SL250 TaxID=2995170 RepID=UPI002270F189|nr:hypothetical protein [Luteolibacter sp. SL250]WAC18900.1 hypothetical protein OVA24_16840 [Luteolibacter sp. SL250]